MIEVEVSNLFFTEVDSSGVTLEEKHGSRKLQIIVGDFEAQAIALGLENIKPPRPITHDLLVSVLDTSELFIEKLVITKIQSNTYFAELHIVKDGMVHIVDSRPSDGIALAVRMGIPIFVEEQIFEMIDKSKDLKKGDFKSNKKSSDIKDMNADQLEEALQKYVDSEDYEMAAKVRDRLNKLNH